MALLNNEAALKFAKELTIVAMENSLIKKDDSPEQSAKNVFDFFNKLHAEFTQNN
ncbi:hypothetical protein [Anaerotignum sp.]|uniref:hypothetical protein n=1 Tax=Anaerotignum sp. TaxID=2039241 RepID=UPI0028995F47|nr:hypothetical protein [Anaerotignum sp.]